METSSTVMNHSLRSYTDDKVAGCIERNILVASIKTYSICLVTGLNVATLRLM